MDIHAYSGFYTDNFKETRTAGILAVLLEANPNMTWDNVLEWAHENGKDDWVPNLDTDDTQPDPVRLIKGDIVFDDRFPFPDNWVTIFGQWKNNFEIGKLPPIQTASPAIQQVFAQPAPVSDPDLTGWDSPAPAQQSFPDDPSLAAWDLPDPVFSQPAPAPAPTPTPIYTQSPAPTAPTTPAPTPIPYPKPTNQPAKKDGSNNMLLIVGGLIVAYMVMKKRKK